DLHSISGYELSLCGSTQNIYLDARFIVIVIVLFIKHIDIMGDLLDKIMTPCTLYDTPHNRSIFP
ncbi:hypothetical protein ACJX0J_015040, partial [Zea mays]